jgi:tetratricopeptide (TPR) repeat protein
MSYLLEALGRGLLCDLRSAFVNQLPVCPDDEARGLQRRLAASPHSRDLALRLGAVHLHAGHLTDARAAFETALRNDPGTTPALLGLACVCDELGQFDQALAYLQQAQERDPGDPAVAFGIGFSHERLERLAPAKLGYRRAQELCPRLRNAYERLAAIAIRELDWPAAVNEYERLVEMESGDLDALLTLGSLYLQVGRAPEAIECYQRALFIEPEISDDPLPSCENIEGEEQIRAAIQKAERLVQKYPGVAPFRVHLGDLYVKAGRDHKAVEQYQDALATQPNFLEATVKLGTQHMRQGRYIDAALTFNRAVELNDRLMTAFAGLGVAQQASGYQREALATFDLAASLEPSSTLLFTEAARLQLQTEQRAELDQDSDEAADDDDALLAEALRRHDRAARQTPADADVHYRRGLLLRQVGRHDDAIAAFRQAIHTNPAFAKAQVKLAVCLKENGQEAEALAAFQHALRLEAKDIDTHYRLGLLFAQRNQFDLATEEFERILPVSEGGAAFRASLVLALQNIGMLDRATAAWHAICELSGGIDLLATREQVLRDANQR